MMETNRQSLTVSKPESIRCLYDKYGGMLLGYIFEIVKDRKIAEEHLVQLFCDLPKQINDREWGGTNTWCKLQGFARARLTAYTHQSDENSAAAAMIVHSQRNQFLERLTAIQKKVFYGVYYQGKSISRLSMELIESEDLIRRTLKEAFTIIKQSGEN